ncbi:MULTISPECIES: hypothetical protein [Bacillaceae]|uniref:hypothetical protein n=1 Tax=Bacillaceae TaxID=186817 RepID=UPI000E73BFFD|nr:hypothetical protein [Bacillus sp. PK3_68]RJS58878.1 hypothetical protein CJ483_01385 [Bacillus sp. PK3_68]
MKNNKRYSWLSYTSLTLGILLAASPVIHARSPLAFDLMIAFYVGIPTVLILSMTSLFKRSEKKLLAFCSLVLAIVMLVFVALLLYIPYHKFDNVLYFIM